MGQVSDSEIVKIDEEYPYRIIVNVRSLFDEAGNYANGWCGYQKNYAMYDNIFEMIEEIRTTLDEFVYHYRGYSYNREDFPR